DRHPVEGLDLASQPTVSRFENAVGVKELYRMRETLARSVIRRHAKRLRRRVYRVTIDLDPTDDPTHGAQQLSFFKCEAVSNVELAGRDFTNCSFPTVPTPHFGGYLERLQPIEDRVVFRPRCPRLVWNRLDSRNRPTFHRQIHFRVSIRRAEVGV